MKLVVMFMFALAMLTANANAGGKWFNGSWFDVECYGCPYLPTETPGKYRKANDGESNPGLEAMNEVNKQKEAYTAARTSYKETFSEADANTAANNSFSTFAEAVIWNNMGFNLIETNGDFTKAREYLTKAKTILDSAEELVINTANSKKNDWNKAENANRAKCIGWVNKNLKYVNNKK